MSQNTDQPETADESLDDEENEKDKFAAKRARARRVLLGALVFVLLALGLYPIWPWLLPAFICEGPMVQMAGQHEVTLVWYMTRPVSDGLAVRIDGDERDFAAECDGRRCRAVIADLQPGQTYPYTIALGGRTLAESDFRTNKPAGETFTFIAFGDSGKATQEQYRLAAQMTAADPDFVLHTGDLIYGRGERSHYDNRFFTPYGDLLRRVCFWPSIGNHDVYEPVGESPYFDVFELPDNGPRGLLPERDYWFDYASARIVVIDSEHDEATLRDRVAPWLETVLADAGAVWKFVVFHRPPYTAGAHAPREEIQRTLVPVFESAGVDIVFNGHDHMYERTHPIRAGKLADDGVGVVYIITGAGGARLYQALPTEERPGYLAAIHNETHSFTRVTVAGDELTLEQIALGGEILDQWTLRQPAGPGESETPTPAP